jgi:acyl-CoA synthetase (NDP forming)
VCSIGNKCDITEIDILEFLLDDLDTKIIALYLESLSNGRRFLNWRNHLTSRLYYQKGAKVQPGPWPL